MTLNEAMTYVCCTIKGQGIKPGLTYRKSISGISTGGSSSPTLSSRRESIFLRWIDMNDAKCSLESTERCNLRSRNSAGEKVFLAKRDSIYGLQAVRICNKEVKKGGRVSFPWRVACMHVLPEHKIDKPWTTDKQAAPCLSSLHLWYTVMHCMDEPCAWEGMIAVSPVSVPPTRKHHAHFLTSLQEITPCLFC